jgi:protein-L-isoaspartate(D-aspartate) O-methyltransferase
MFGSAKTDVEAQFARERRLMIQRMQVTTGIDDRRVLNAFLATPRHCFVPQSQRDQAYEDKALPLGEGQTISQPSMIAIMLSELQCRPEDVALEVGAGSGYAAALLGQMVERVHAIEIRPRLAERAQLTLAEIGADNVYIHVSDGTLGLPEYAPFDRILVSAAAPSVPAQLVDQLAPGGRLACPTGSGLSQTLWVCERALDGSVSTRESVPCLFVPIVHPNDV